MKEELEQDYQLLEEQEQQLKESIIFADQLATSQSLFVNFGMQKLEEIQEMKQQIINELEKYKQTRQRPIARNTIDDLKNKYSKRAVFGDTNPYEEEDDVDTITSQVKEGAGGNNLAQTITPFKEAQIPPAPKPQVYGFEGIPEIDREKHSINYSENKPLVTETKPVQKEGGILGVFRKKVQKS